MREPPRPEPAFTRVDLIVVVAVTAVLSLIPLSAWAASRARAHRVQCVANLKTIGWAFHEFAGQYNGRYPMQQLMITTQGGPWGPPLTLDNVLLAASFAVVSNQLQTPKSVVCPSDSRIAATNFNMLTSFSHTNVSYFVGIGTSEQSPRMFLAGDRNLGNSPNGLPYDGVRVVGTNNAFVTWVANRHDAVGHVLFPDGSVHSFGTAQLRAALRDTGDPLNNRFLFSSPNSP